jgi:autotransporter-associated beta strand protein
VTVAAGTTILTATNTYSGGTTVNGGTLAGGHANGAVIDTFGSDAITLNGGTLLTYAGSLPNAVIFATGATSTLAAAAGATLAMGGPLSILGNAQFGSATDTGTIGISFVAGETYSGLGTISVNGGRLVAADSTLTFFTSAVASTTVAANATLDFSDQSAAIHNLLGTASTAVLRTGASAATSLLVGQGNFAGSIVGAGSLHLTNLLSSNGTLILSGINTYTGGTTIDPGFTLQLGNGGAGGSIVGDITNNGTLAFNRSDSYSFAGVISGGGALQQDGARTTVLTGANTYTGATTVNGGTLEVDGSIANSSGVIVNAGGTLSGTGIVDPTTTTIMSGGTLAPGNTANPTGTLSITGNLAFQSGALYLVHLTPSAAVSTNVSGTALLTGGIVQAVFAPGSYVAKSYDILHAAGGLGGTTFAGLSGGLPGFDAGLSYTATDVFLNLTASLGGGLGDNQQKVANAINNVFKTGGTLPPAFANLFGLTGGNLGNALSQLDGETSTGAERGAFQLMNQFLGLMLDPFVDGRFGGGGMNGPALGFAPEREEFPPEIALAYAQVFKAQPKPPQDNRWSVWGSGFGGASHANGDPTIGSNDVTANWLGRGLSLHPRHAGRLRARQRGDELGAGAIPRLWPQRRVPGRCLRQDRVGRHRAAAGRAGEATLKEQELANRKPSLPKLKLSN